MALDPFTALSLAGVVVQFVDFSAKIFCETWRLYKCRGCNDQHEEIDCINQDISRIFSDITKAASQRDDELSNDPGLQSLIKECLSLSQQLKAAIGDAHRHKIPGRKWKSFREALKRIWNQDKINEFRHRLSCLQEQLILHLQTSQSKLLVSMRESVGILQAGTNQCNDLHYENSQLLKSAIHSLEQIRLKISTVNSISATYEALADVTNPEMERRARVLRNLLFGYMTSRYLSITEAHVQTFKWVFSDNPLPENDPHSKVLFTEWLRSGTGIYWISGKPGSGKSTLVKYIVDHPETTSALKVWSKTSNLTIAKFFFWNAGTAMQKSLLGLLQSLVFEILSRRPEWIPAVCPTRWSSHVASLTEWTMPELKSILKHLLRQEVTPSEKFCFFIDGLDEYDGDMHDILDCLYDINCSTHVKLCVSSRPWNCFEESLGKRKDQKLYMEKLTRDDIAKYAYNRISSFMLGCKYIDAVKMASKLCEEIVQKAQGVFLWVALAVSSLQRGIINRDSVSILCTRLHAFPRELLDFFHHILDQVESVYREKTSCLFKIALECDRPMSVFAYSIIMDDNPEFGVLVSYAPMPFDDMQQRLLFAERQLDACCKGLLEVQPIFRGYAKPGSGRTESSKSYNTVGYLHRTVRDFLLYEYKPWEQFLPQSFCPHLAISRALLGELKACPVESSTCGVEENMLQACVKADENETLDPRVLDQLNVLKDQPWDLGNVEQCKIHSRQILEIAIDRGMPNYIRTKVSEGLFKTSSWREYCDKHFLDKAFENLEGPKRLEIIEILLRGGAGSAMHRSDGRLAELMSCNTTDWGSPSHAHIVQEFLSGGIDVNVRNMHTLAWGQGIMENFQKRPTECTLRMLRQYFKYAADPNDQYDNMSGRSVWEEFLDMISSLRPSNIADGYADHIEEFLRHGANPFIAGFGPRRNLSLMHFVGQCFSYDQSRRLGTVLSGEMEHHRARASQRHGIPHVVQNGKTGGPKRNKDALSLQRGEGPSEGRRKRRRMQL